MSKKVLITGAGGFIGSALAKRLADAEPDAEIELIDHFNDASVWENGKRRFFGTYANLKGVRGRVMAMDITSEAFVKELREFEPDVIYHFAAISDTTVYNEAAVLATNLNSFYPLLEFCARSGAKMVYASSASVYGRHEGLCKPWCDEGPINPYAFSKLQMDIAARGTGAVGLRFFNVYGPGEFYKDSTSSMALQWALAMLAGRSVRMFDDSARTLRDFVYIDDVVDVCLRAQYAAPGVYNVGSGKQASFAAVVDALEAALGVSAKREQIANPYVANYQYSTLAALDGELVKEPDMRDITAGCAAYASELRYLASELSSGRLKSGFFS